MEHIGIDLHKTSSQICILSEDGELTERRIKSTKANFDEVFAERPRARILVLSNRSHLINAASCRTLPVCQEKHSPLNSQPTNFAL
jgi:hypothetical protein